MNILPVYRCIGCDTRIQKEWYDLTFHIKDVCSRCLHERCLSCFENRQLGTMCTTCIYQDATFRILARVLIPELSFLIFSFIQPERSLIINFTNTIHGADLICATLQEQ